MNELTVIVAKNGQIEAANPSFLTLAGCLPLELEQANIKEFIAESDWTNFARARNALLGGQPSATFTTQFGSQPETRTVSWSMTQDGQMFYLVGRR